MNAGMTASMAPVVDARSWAEGTWESPNYNVRIYASQITEQLRNELSASKLFAALPPAGSADADATPLVLSVKVNSFKIEDSGSNAYRVPQVVVNGALLPVYAVTNVASMGQIDMAGYVIPSTNVSTSLQADIALYDKEFRLVVFRRSYQARVRLGAVSQRDMLSGSEGVGYNGVEIGRAQGQKAITDLADLISRDPAWKLIDQHRAISIAKKEADDGASLQTKADAAVELLGLIRPIVYTSSEVKLLYDGTYDERVRTKMFNDYRARALGLPNAEALPADMAMTEAKATALLDDASLVDNIALDDMDRLIIDFAVNVIVPPLPKKAPAGVKGKAPEAAPAPVQAAEPANADQIRAQVTAALVHKLQGDALLQNMLLDAADKAIGPQWPVMKNVLKQIDTPVVQQYMAKRQ